VLWLHGIELGLGGRLSRQRLFRQVLTILGDCRFRLILEVVDRVLELVSCSSICLREAAMSTRARRTWVICSSIFS